MQLFNIVGGGILDGSHGTPTLPQTPLPWTQVYGAWQNFTARATTASFFRVRFSFNASIVETGRAEGLYKLGGYPYILEMLNIKAHTRAHTHNIQARMHKQRCTHLATKSTDRVRSTQRA